LGAIIIIIIIEIRVTWANNRRTNANDRQVASWSGISSLVLSLD
jgi:hypothetical protein